MLRDMAVGHPATRVRRLQQNVHGGADGEKHRVLPGEVGRRHPVPLEDQEALPVEVNGMAHRVHRLGIVEQADLRHLALPEVPVDVHVLFAGGRIAHDPAGLFAGRDPVHVRHAVVPFDRREIHRVGGHEGDQRDRQPLDVDRQVELAIDGPVERLAIALELRAERGVPAERVERRIVVLAHRCPRHSDLTECVHLRVELACDVVDGLDAIRERVCAVGIEPHVDHIALGRGEDHGAHHFLTLEATHVGRDQLDRSASEREVVGPAVRGVGEKEPHHGSSADGEPIARLSVDEEHIPKPSHDGEVGRLPAEREQPLAIDQEVVEQQHLLAVHGTVIGPVGRLHQDVAEQAEALLDVFAHVRVVPVDARVREAHPVDVAAPDRHGLLRHAGSAVGPVVDPHAVPMQARRHVELVLEAHDDGGVLFHPQQRSRVLTVVAVHHEAATADHPAHERRAQGEGIAIGETHRRARRGERDGGRGGGVEILSRQERRHPGGQVLHAAQHGHPHVRRHGRHAQRAPLPSHPRHAHARHLHRVGRRGLCREAPGDR